jgi:hypothetical protein
VAPGPNHPDNTHPARQIPGLSENQIQRLHDRWIDTAEALLGAAATPEGKSGLAELLGLSPGQLEPLVQQAIDIVGADMARELMSPQRGGPTGVILTDEQRRKWGLR